MMAYKYFESGLPIAKDPQTRYRDDWNAFVNKSFTNASNVYTVGEETTSGTQFYEDVPVRITYVVNPSTGIKLSDDWKAFLFNVDHETNMGARYLYENNVWLTVNTEKFASMSQNCIVRRCNNYLTMKDKYGNIHKEPCVIDPALKYGNIYYNNAVDIPQGTIKIWLQFNSYTKDININNRFIIGYNEVYKVKTVVNYLNNYTFDLQGSPLMELDMQLDSIQAGDDFTTGLAGATPTLDYAGSNKHIMVSPQNYIVPQGQRRVYECFYQNETDKSTDTFEFTILSNTIPTERYLYETINGNSFAITNNQKYTKEALPVQCKNLVTNEIKVFNFTLGGAI
jgi:hypothetical protein